MAVPVEAPQLGNTVEECLVARWLRRKGETVLAGDVVLEIETDKTTFDLEAPVGGTVLETFFEEGTLVPVFTNLFVIGEPGEDAEKFRPAQAPSVAEPPPPPVAARSPGEPAASATAPAPAAPMSPRARRFADEHGFHPAAVAGSGPGGRILEADLRALYQTAAGAPAALSGIRAKIARRMRESLATTAQYTLHASADAGGLLRLRARAKAAGMAYLGINELVTFCAVRAVLDVPELNAELIDGTLRRHDKIHIGFACDTPKGLLVPVVRDAGALGAGELAQRMKRLAAQAVEGTIAVDNLAGATFTVSNLGNLGIESFTPVLNPPQVAILGVNAIQPKPMRRAGTIEFIDSIGLSLTLDHQAIDGAPGAGFLKVVREKIETVESLCKI